MAMSGPFFKMDVSRDGVSRVIQQGSGRGAMWCIVHGR
jgi:hypothetical protein